MSDGGFEIRMRFGCSPAEEDSCIVKLATGVVHEFRGDIVIEKLRELLIFLMFERVERYTKELEDIFEEGPRMPWPLKDQANEN